MKMTDDTIPSLTCPKCGGKMTFSNRQHTAVVCVNNPKHRKSVKTTHIEGQPAQVSFCKKGPDKQYPITYDMQMTEKQRMKLDGLGGAEFLRRCIDTA